MSSRAAPGMLLPTPAGAGWARGSGLVEHPAARRSLGAALAAGAAPKPLDTLLILEPRMSCGARERRVGRDRGGR